MVKMKRVFAIVILVGIGFWLANGLSEIPFGHNKMIVGHYYLENVRAQTGAINTVTSVIVNYRGLDTLGEVTVLFIASTGVAALLWREDTGRVAETEGSLILKTGSKILYPLILLFGVYIFVHGHLTPGGGFPGGAVIATAFLMLYLSYEEFDLSHKLLEMSEGTAGILYVSVGLIGLLIGGFFLFDWIWRVWEIGSVGNLVSAGYIPIIYIIIAVKVGTELIGILDRMIKEPKEDL